MFVPISNAGFWDEVFESGDEFIENGSNQTQATDIDETELKAMINTIYNALLALGIVASVLIGAGLGIKHILGSVEEQAKTKEMLIPYIVGCIAIFGAFGIWKLIIEIIS